jgi:LPS sulfotransferase NodH
MTYEEMAEDLDKAVRDVAAFLDVTLPPDLGPIRPQMQRQADRHTDRFVQQFDAGH